MFSLTQAANASVASDVYGMISLKEGVVVFKSLQQDSFGIEVEIDESSFENIDVGCEEGIFTLAQSLRKDRSFEILEVTCETLINAGF